MTEQEQDQQEETQLQFLQEAKAMLSMTWDELAEQSGIAPRALKNYRMPAESSNHRAMPSLAWRSVRQLLDEHAKKNRKKAA